MKESDDDVDNKVGDPGACSSSHGVGNDSGTGTNGVEHNGESTSYHNRATSCDTFVNGSIHPNIKQLICNIPNGVSPAVNNNLSSEKVQDKVNMMPPCIDCNRVTSSGSALEGRVNGLHLNGNGSLSAVNGDGPLKALSNNVNCCSSSQCSPPIEDIFSDQHDNLSANCDATLERRSSADRRGARWRDDSSSSDTGNEGEDGLSADECCIYTYKGDQMADLPNSFFRVDGDQAAPRVEPRANNGLPSRSSSPEMDFLEMDFDPGPSCEQDSDQYSDRYSDRDSLRDDEVDVFADMHGNDLAEQQDGGGNDPIRLGYHTPEVEAASSSALRDPLPERNLRDMPSTSSATFHSQPAELSLDGHFALKHTGLPVDKGRRIWAHHGLVGELCPPTEQLPSGEPNAVLCGFDNPNVVWTETEPMQTSMIWTEEEAGARQVTQIGPSACGATSVINALSALGIPSDVARATAAVSTRARRNSAPLADYLASRSEAGAAHDDLIRGLIEGSDGRVVARFFHMYPRPPLPLAAWLSRWIARGAVPIATLNLQRGVSAGCPIPDAWHHQMVFGARGGDSGGGLVWLTNPLEAVREAALWPQLSSAPVLRVRREDVTSRWTPTADLRPLAADLRWRRLNVLGQVVNVVREHVASTSTPGHVTTQHVTIPARYSSGITLAVVRDSLAHAELLAAPDLLGNW